MLRNRRARLLWAADLRKGAGVGFGGLGFGGVGFNSGIGYGGLGFAGVPAYGLGVNPALAYGGVSSFSSFAATGAGCGVPALLPAAVPYAATGIGCGATALPAFGVGGYGVSPGFSGGVSFVGGRFVRR